MTLLFTPYTLRGMRARNRVVISPMQQASATDGMAGDWHLAHLGRFAMGGAGMVFVESTAVEARGRNTYGDTGLWNDAQIEPYARIADMLRQLGAIPAIQLGHTGRKAGLKKWWLGNRPLTQEDALHGEPPWTAVAPSALAFASGWPTPQALDTAQVEALVQAWGASTRRARDAGFGALEVHGAHGYLIHQFLSPISNQRTDRFGQDRMRFALDVAEAVRREWPEDRPLFWRVSLADVVEGGMEFEAMVELLRKLKARGVDVVDCSSGGGIASHRSQGKSVFDNLGFRADTAAQLRKASGLQVMGVGVIITPEAAEHHLQAQHADLIAIGREALYNPNWPLHAEAALGANQDYASWPPQYRSFLARRAAAADALRKTSIGLL